MEQHIFVEDGDCLVYKVVPFHETQSSIIIVTGIYHCTLSGADNL